MIPVGILTAAPTSSFSFLLDLYPSAAGAFSLRKLRAAYTGNCVQVRRSSDNSTQDIGFINNVLDTTALLTFVGPNNGFVSIWYDQSVSNVNATQSTLANQPQIVTAGVLETLNSKPSIKFGNNINVNLGLPNTGIIPQPTNFFLFGNNDGTINAHFFDSVNQRQLLGVIGTDLINFAGALGVYGANNTNANLYSTLFNGASSNIVRNGVLVNVNAGVLPYQNLIIGSGQGANSLKGKISEIVFYHNNQNSNRIGIQTNINSFYTIY
jgi:hypothetical protein